MSQIDGRLPDALPHGEATVSAEASVEGSSTFTRLYGIVDYDLGN